VRRVAEVHLETEDPGTHPSERAAEIHGGVAALEIKEVTSTAEVCTDIWREDPVRACLRGNGERRCDFEVVQCNFRAPEVGRLVCCACLCRSLGVLAEEIPRPADV
jgi:hypothetical protein